MASPGASSTSVRLGKCDTRSRICWRSASTGSPAAIPMRTTPIGARQLTFFNGHYDSWCYLPLLAFLTFNEEAEQYLCAAILRPGNAPATRGAKGTLIRLLDLLRVAFPRARFLVRLDGGFATPEILDRLDAEPGLDYVIAMAENAVLTRCAERTMVEARTQSEASGQTEHVYTEARYAAGTWPHE